MDEKLHEIDRERKTSRQKPLNFSASQIRNALESTKSLQGASDYLNISRITLKKYVVAHFGEEFYISKRNQGGKGIAKSVRGERRELSRILNGDFNGTKLDNKYLIRRIVNEGEMVEECDLCGYSEQRIIDYRCPLLLDFNNDDRRDYRRENLRLLCYNCYFINVGNLHGSSPKYEPIINPLTGDPIDEYKF